MDIELAHRFSLFTLKESGGAFCVTGLRGKRSGGGGRRTTQRWTLCVPIILSRGKVFGSSDTGAAGMGRWLQAADERSHGQLREELLAAADLLSSTKVWMPNAPAVHAAVLHDQ